MHPCYSAATDAPLTRLALLLAGFCAQFMLLGLQQSFTDIMDTLTEGTKAFAPVKALHDLEKRITPAVYRGANSNPDGLDL